MATIDFPVTRVAWLRNMSLVGVTRVDNFARLVLFQELYARIVGRAPGAAAPELEALL